MSRWDWEDPARRVHLEPGMKLLDWDCALWFVVRAEENGVVLADRYRLVESSDPEKQDLVGRVISEERFYSWAEMNQRTMFTYDGE